MRYGFYTLLICLINGLDQGVVAQQQIFKNYTVNDGLISNSVRRIYQDSKGFLWIATWEGLSKFDGHSFTNFNTANGLSHSLVNDMYETKDGSLLICLNNKTIDAIRNNKVFKNAVYTNATVNQVTASATQYPTLTTDGEGLQELRNGKIVRPGQAFPNRSYYDLHWLNDSLFMAAGDSAIGIYNSNWVLLSEMKDPVFLYNPAKIFKDSKQQVWIGTANGVRMIKALPANNRTRSLTTLPPPYHLKSLRQKRINVIFEDDIGNMWFGTNAGLVKLGINGTEQLITVKDGIASNIITCIYQDREKNIWFGTAVGLSKLVTRSSITLYPLENGIYTSDNLYLLHPYKKDHFLLSTIDGTKIFNKSTSSFTAAAAPKNEIFYNMIQNSRPPVLMGSLYTAQFDTLHNQYFSVEALLPQGISRMIIDEMGNRFCSNLEQLFFCSNNVAEPILHYRISSLLIDKKGYLWAGTWQNGLFRIKYRIANNRIEIISKDQYLSNENIRCLLQDAKGNIWAGTRYKGVYRFASNEKDDWKITNYDQSTGLSSDFIKSIKEDVRGNIWIAFYQGLDKLIPVNSGYQILNFSRLSNYFTSMIGLHADADNSLWLATGEGLVHIKDGELEKSPPLPVYITKVQIGDTSFSIDQQTHQLNYRQKQVEFEFSAPGFINEKQVLYSYRLTENGATAGWSPPANQHAVSYANLQPGSYLFEVRTLGWNSEWGQPAHFSFTINPPYWQTWWFRLMAILAAAGMFFFLFRKRIQTIRHEAELKQKIAETEMMALRAQMNPHFIFNCLNSIDNLIQTDDKEKATLYLSKFAKLIRFILENAAHNTVPCWKDMETMQLYLELESLRFDHKFTYQLSIAPEILNGDYKVPPLIVQPYLENAIHHGLLNKLDGDKKLKVEVYASANHVHYVIEDNGIGRKQAATYKQNNKLAYASMGMQLTEERINHFNQQQHGAVQIEDLFDENNQPRGTKVSIAVIVQS